MVRTFGGASEEGQARRGNGPKLNVCWLAALPHGAAAGGSAGERRTRSATLATAAAHCRRARCPVARRYESAEMYWELRDCGVPAKHLVYNKVTQTVLGSEIVILASGCVTAR